MYTFSFHLQLKFNNVCEYFSRCNFSNRLNFESLTEDEIDQVEQFVREKGLDFAQKKLQKKIECHEEILLHDEQLIDYFGETYASNPSNFRFEIGDRKLIRIFRDHLIEQQNEKGAKYMRRFRKKPDRKNPKRFKLDERTCTLKTENEQSVNDGENFDDADDVYCQKLSAGLFERVRNYMETFDIDKSIIEKINPNIVSVKIAEGLVIAGVFCAVCQNDETKKRKSKAKRVFYKDGEGSNYWVLSNFGQHLKSVHKLKSCLPECESLDDAKKTDANVISMNSGTKKIHDFASSVDIKADDTENNTPTVANDDKLALAHNFSVEYDDVKVDPSYNAISSDSNVMFDQITSQIMKMVKATLSHSDATKQMFFELFEGESRSLKVAVIRADGSCLFSSIAHQLFTEKIRSKEHIEATKQLRKSVVEYISSHYSSFRFELRGRVYEEIDPNAIDDMEKECKDILKNYLPMDYFWGGTETLKAIQEMHHVNILIFNENAPCYFFNHFNEANTKTLILAFRYSNGNDRDHYDSVCDMSSVEILNAINFLSNTALKTNAVLDQTL